MSKETFIIRTEWAAAIMELDPIDRATIFENLFHYHEGDNNLINLNNLSVKLVWKLIEPNLHRNIESYDKRRDTSSNNGKKGGRPKNGSENNLNNLKEPIEKPIENEKPIESLSVSVSDSVSVIKEEEEEPLARLLKLPVAINPNRGQHCPKWEDVAKYFVDVNEPDEAQPFFEKYEAGDWRNPRNQPWYFFPPLANSWLSKAAENRRPHERGKPNQVYVPPILTRDDFSDEEQWQYYQSKLKKQET